MDSGYLEPGETMEDDYDYTQPLLPEEVIGIIDQLLCHEVITSIPEGTGLILDRWPGIWDIHFLRQFLPVYILTGF